MEEVTANEKTDKTVAFFYITSSGLVQVRNSSDYIPKMIELAGGKYIFENMGIRIVPLQICRKNSITVQRMRISLSITTA